MWETRLLTNLTPCLFPLYTHTGARDDLEKVTGMAYRQVTEYGMSPVIGHISLPQPESSTPRRRMYSQKLAKMIDEVGVASWCKWVWTYIMLIIILSLSLQEVKELVNRAYEKTEHLLQANKNKLKIVSFTY